MAVTKNKRDGELSIIDGSMPSAVETTITFCEGDFTYNEPKKKEPIVVKERTGALAHIKSNDAFSGYGQCSFAFKYVNKTIKGLMCNPATTSAIGADKINSRYKTVNVKMILKSEAGATEETHTLYNVFFDPGKVVFKESGEYSTLSATGIIFGKIDTDVRKFVDVT